MDEERLGIDLKTDEGFQTRSKQANHMMNLGGTRRMGPGKQMSIQASWTTISQAGSSSM